MRILSYLSFCCFLFLLVSCSKDKVPIPIVSPEKSWEKFVGNYKVYDTTGVYLFDAIIEHFTGNNQFNVPIDSLKIRNFCNSINLKFEFIRYQDSNFIDIAFHDSIKDFENNTWSITRISNDPSSQEIENTLVNNRMTLYFRKTNIKYWMNESVPYVYENVKHVYVKQP